ncbi:BfmA/BtgA family mobilization protein [Pedobacter gandavensis]|uniref:BfmA/BtgA family mobilization protein n=1 Tax=Pedobacter gandavensis TaxID=2679963 RepID=UPI00292EACAB|nr:BfmA/BtgA family mobilization protein [Pedobacter gandavensis]
MEHETLRTVKFPEAVALKFDKIALKLGRSKRKLFTQMVDYFFRSKKDPSDLNDEFLKTTLLKSHKDYIGFIRTQENELLIPIKTDVTRMVVKLGEIVDCFNAQVIRHNDKLMAKQLVLLDNQDVQVRKFSQTDELMKLVLNKLETKDQLKRKFLHILDAYIKARNSFSITTAGKEKDELIQKTKDLINYL